jgi:hypothetical protein
MSTSVSTVNATTCPPPNTVIHNCTYRQVCLYLRKSVSRGAPVILFSLGHLIFSSMYSIDHKFISRLTH